ncbi:phage portal protein [uncultured Jatrophihabitans sp.]|uniref:phage portal protein n=1 Tax=uncultured Jatrophihabitans sp. TaxID=1610747 RepID=UPI0035C96AC7
MFEWETAAPADKVSYLGLQLQAQSNALAQLELYYEGRQPTAFVSLDIATQLQNRLVSLNVNYCRLLVENLVQRITLNGFKLDGAMSTDASVWDVWTRNRMQSEFDWALRDFLALGRTYILVWKDKQGRVSLSVESPKQVTAYRNPVTREVEGALKQWATFNDVTNQQHAWSVLYLPDEVITFTSASPAAVNSIPNTGWRVTDRQPNPLGVVPMVEIANKTNVLDWTGTSEFEPIMGLQDALNKTLLDSMVASEFASFARRWATGLAVPDDEDGNPAELFGMSWNEIWTSEDAETKFGAFPSQSLTGFDTQSNLLTRHISAISGLPEFLTGTGLSNPQSIDAINASELTITAKAQQKLDLLTPALAEVGALVVAIGDNRRAVNTAKVAPVFADLQNRSDTAKTDQFVKLTSVGMSPRVAARMCLGWSESDAAQLPDTPITTNGNQDERTNAAA